MKIKLRKNALLEPARVFMRGHVLSSCHLRVSVDNNNLAYLKHAEMIKLQQNSENYDLWLFITVFILKVFAVSDGKIPLSLLSHIAK